MAKKPPPRRTVSKTLHTESHYSGSIKSLQALLDNCLSLVPEDCKDKAYVEVTLENDFYGDRDYPNLYIYYEAPETDEQYADRLAKEAVEETRRHERELKEYERLKKQFGSIDV